MDLPKATHAVVPVQLTRLDCETGRGPPSPHKIRVLVADDHVESAHVLGDALRQQGYACEVALTGDRALDIVRHLACDVVICDAQTQGMSEFGLLDQLMSVHPTLPVIVATNSFSVAKAVEAVKRGAFQYVEKAFNTNALLGFVAQATEDFQPFPSPSWPPRHAAEVAQSELVQASAIMRELVASIALVARSNAPVLILGESGTGKERVARAIHAAGPRMGQPFVAVNTSPLG